MRFLTSLLCCAFVISNASSQLTVLELLSAAPSNSHFNEIVANDELNALLASEAGVTVLVPDNDAVDAYAAAMGMTTIKVVDPGSALAELGAVLGLELT